MKNPRPNKVKTSAVIDPIKTMTFKVRESTIRERNEQSGMLKQAGLTWDEWYKIMWPVSKKILKKLAVKKFGHLFDK